MAREAQVAMSERELLTARTAIAVLVEQEMGLCVSELIINVMGPKSEKKEATRLENNLAESSKALEDAMAKERYLGSQVNKYQELVVRNGSGLREALEVRGKAAEVVKVARNNWAKADVEVERKRAALAGAEATLRETRVMVGEASANTARPKSA